MFTDQFYPILHNFYSIPHCSCPISHSCPTTRHTPQRCWPSHSTATPCNNAILAIQKYSLIIRPYSTLISISSFYSWSTSPLGRPCLPVSPLRPPSPPHHYLVVDVEVVVMVVVLVVLIVEIVVMVVVLVVVNYQPAACLSSERSSLRSPETLNMTVTWRKMKTKRSPLLFAFYLLPLIPVLNPYRQRALLGLSYFIREGRCWGRSRSWACRSRNCARSRRLSRR